MVVWKVLIQKKIKKNVQSLRVGSSYHNSWLTEIVNVFWIFLFKMKPKFSHDSEKIRNVINEVLNLQIIIDLHIHNVLERLVNTTFSYAFANKRIKVLVISSELCQDVSITLCNIDSLYTSIINLTFHTFT